MKISINICCLILIFLLSSCALNNMVSQTKTGVASIKVIDKANYKGELFRHISWNGENYGPSAFISVAKREKINQLVLISGDLADIECLAALANEINASATTDDVEDGAKNIRTDNTKTLKDVCEIYVHIPKPSLPKGYLYVQSDVDV